LKNNNRTTNQQGNRTMKSMITKSVTHGIALLIATVGVTLSALAQVQVASSVIAAGGGIAAGSGITVNGTVGQPVIGPARGASTTVAQGFWFTPQKPAASLGVESSTNTVDGLRAEAFPNPCRDNAIVRIVIGSRSAVRASLFDELGNEVALLYDDSSEAGELRIKIDATSLPSGHYIIRVISGNGSMAVPLVVVQ
jgi:hypothetical protein